MDKDIQKEGKLTENKILIVMVMLVAVILFLNWMAYKSISIDVSSQELIAHSESSNQTSDVNAPIVD